MLLHRFSVVHFLLCFLDLDSFLSDVEPQAVVDAHVLVRDPNECEKGDWVSAPILIKQLEASERKGKIW